jgi:hypothetical protein
MDGIKFFQTVKNMFCLHKQFDDERDFSFTNILGVVWDLAQDLKISYPAMQNSYSGA